MNKKVLIAGITSVLVLFSNVGCSTIMKDYKDKQATEQSVPKFEHYYTSNGMEVILKKITTNDIVGVKLFLRGGSRNLNTQNAGIEKLLFNTMFEGGSVEYPKDKLNLELSKMGIKLGTDFFYDSSNLSLKCINKYFHESFNIFQSLINNPLLDENEIELQKNRMVTGLKKEIDDPDTLVWKTVNKSFFANHPYQNTFGGELETIPNITKNDLVEYKKQNFVGSKFVLIVVGNFHDCIKKDIEKYFGKLEKGNYKVEAVQPIEINSSSVNIVDKKIPTAYVGARFVIPSPRDKDFPAINLALRILSQNLHDVVRTKHGLSYAVSSGASLRDANSGYMYVTTIKPNETVKLMFEEIEKMKKEPVSEEFLKGVINVYYTSYFMTLESNLEQAEFYGLYRIVSDDYNRGFDLLEQFKKVTPEDIKDVMNKYAKNLHFGIIYEKDKIQEDLFKQM